MKPDGEGDSRTSPGKSHERTVFFISGNAFADVVPGLTSSQAGGRRV